jgi:hypothetical protein
LGLYQATLPLALTTMNIILAAQHLHAQPNVKGHVSLVVVNGMLNLNAIHKLPKSPLKSIVMAHPIALDDDFGMDKIAQGIIILTFKSFMTN